MPTQARRGHWNPKSGVNKEGWSLKTESGPSRTAVLNCVMTSCRRGWSFAGYRGHNIIYILGLHIKYPAYQIFTLQSLTIAKLVSSSNSSTKRMEYQAKGTQFESQQPLEFHTRLQVGEFSCWATLQFYLLLPPRCRD